MAMFILFPFGYEMERQLIVLVEGEQGLMRGLNLQREFLMNK